MIEKLKKSDFFLSVLINSIVLGIVLLLFQPYFETNDDNSMAWISEGGTSGYSDHLVYINILYGKIIKMLNMLVPDIRWYSIVFFAILFCSFTSVVYVFLGKMGKKRGIVCSLIMLTCFSYYGYVSVQFTRVAGIASAAGLLLVFGTLDRKIKPKILPLGIGCSLAILGSLIRFNMFLMICAIISGLGVWKMIELYKSDRWKKVQKIIPYILIMLAIVLTAVLGKIYDTYAYDADHGWKEYREYDSLRSQILDYGFPDYYENQEEYQALGLDANDIWYYQNWNFADPEKFNTEIMKEILELKPKKEINGEFIKDFLLALPIGLFREPAFVYFCIIFLFYCINFRKNIGLILYASVVLIGIQTYLFYQGRYLMARVDDPIWFSISCVFLYAGVPLMGEKVSTYKNISFLLISLLGINGSVLAANILGDKDEEQIEKEEKIVEMISSDKDHIYFSTVLGFSTDNLFDIWNRPSEYLLSNLYSLGGWQTNSPLTNAVKEKYGIENPFRDCIDNEKVYLILGDQKDITEDYIKRNYNENAELVAVKEIEEEVIYQVVERKD